MITAHRYGPWAVAVTGLVAMAQGVSLGRFVFTPMLTIMLNDRSVNLTQGGRWRRRTMSATCSGHCCASASAAIRRRWSGRPWWRPSC